MVVSLKANRKRILAFLILVVIVVGAVVFLKMDKGADSTETYPGGTNEERVAFLQSFGWQVSAEASETREVMIPAKFNDVYTTYNVMQKAQGFDLKPYAGEICTQYKYKIENYPNVTEVYATLLVYGEIIIGGDVACAEVDGFMHGFAPDSARYGETGEKAAKSGKDEAVSSSQAAESSLPESSMSGAEETVSTVTEEESALESSEAVESTGGEVIPEDAYPTD